MVEDDSTADMPKRRLSDIILVGLFSLWIAVPALIGVIAPDRETSKSENRRLAQLPGPIKKLEDTQEWTNDFTLYLQDQVGLREDLSRVNGNALYNVGISPSEDVIIGKQEFLFGTTNKVSNDILRAALTNNYLTDANLAAALKGWTATANYARENNAPYVIAIVPSKLNLYQDMLSKSLRENLAENTMLDQAESAAKTANLPFLNLTSTLQRERDKGVQVWRRQDTHWNRRGAFASCQAIIESLNEQSATKLKFISPRNVKPTVEIAKNGDLARLIGLGGTLSEETASILINDGVKEIDRDTVTKNGQVVQLDIRSNGLNNATLFVSADSFMWATIDCFKSSFTRVVWYRNSRQEIPADILAQYDPDYIVNMNIEKSLLWLKE